ncbi:MAG: hypothetical protein E7165_02130 [Firmicutes bacterium]|nr:hypothetical protein [Bacillota bacterium]
MKLKRLFLLIIIFLITGCSVDYNLTVNDDYTFEESVTILQPNSLWGSSQEEISRQVYWALVFARDETEPAYFYRQEKILGDSKSGAKLSYTFSKDEFKSQSAFLKSCFSSYDVLFQGNKLYLTAGGFKCYDLLGDNYDLRVNINVQGQTISGNYNSKNNNTYTWVLKKEDDVIIDLVVDITKEEVKSSDDKNLIIGIIIGVIILLIGVALVAYKKIKDNNN